MWPGVPYSNPEHPPLAKYLIGLGVLSLGDNSAGWRAASVVFGSLTLVVIFLWISEIADVFTGWVAVLLVVCNGFWFVMSRLAMISIFELFFCVAGFYLLSKDKPVWSGVSLGLACACRWMPRLRSRWWWAGLLCGGAANQEGGGDRVHVDCCLYPGLSACRQIQLAGICSGANLYFYFHRHPTGNVQASQRWYLWPLRREPEFYINSLFGNRIIIVVGAIAVVYLLVRSKHRLVALAPLVFWMQWAVTGRPFEFYYYFMDSIVFLSIAAALFLGEARSRVKWLPAVMVSICVIWFMLQYPHFAYVATPWDGISNYVSF